MRNLATNFLYQSGIRSRDVGFLKLFDQLIQREFVARFSCNLTEELLYLFPKLALYFCFVASWSLRSDQVSSLSIRMRIIDFEASASCTSNGLAGLSLPASGFSDQQDW